jgi:GNAT superfamily N-acetyltransferase
MELQASARVVVDYARRHGIRRTASRLVRAVIYSRERIYLTRGDLVAEAAQPLTTDGFEVRRARADDPLVKAFPHLTAAKVSTWLGPDHLWFVLLRVGYRCVSTHVDRSVSGFLRLRPHQAYTVFIYTHPAFRRHGLSHVLRVAIARELVRHGFREVWSAESPTNYDTLIATERRGLPRVGTLTRTCVLGRVGFSLTPANHLSPAVIHGQLVRLKDVVPRMSHVGVLFNASVTTLDSESALKQSIADLATGLTVIPVRETTDQCTTFATALAMVRDGASMD